MNTKIMTYLFLIAGLIALLILFSCRKKSANLKYGFSKEQDTIKFQNEIVKGIDATTFEILDENYCKDKNQVFYFRTYRESRDYFFTKKHQIQKLENADAASFLTLGYGYAKDNARAWYNGSNFKVADIPGLAALNHHFTQDNINVYLDCKQVLGIDGSTFEIIDTYYAKDAKQYYYCNPGGDDQYSITAIPCQYESFSIIDYQYSKDNTSVYFREKKMLMADAASFIIIGSQYAKDNNNVYFNAKEIPGADPNTFELFKENENSNGETYYARDKKGIYVNDQYFKDADAQSFRIFNEKYTMDNQGIYYKMKKMKNADPTTFKVYPHYMGDADAEDKHHKYGDGKVVE